MTIRKVIFWLHLIVGLTMGAFIFAMSLTGVLLTYERQMSRWAENAAIEAPADADPLNYQALADAVVTAGGAPGHVMTVPNGREGAVPVSAGRRSSFLLNPYTGEVMEGAGDGTHAFFSRVERIHRWLAFYGGRSESGAAINGAANLLFALLVVTGIYLWLPKIWRGAMVRIRLVFGFRHPNAKARHFNWHHAAGIWFAIPLLAITLSGTMFSYGWVRDLINSVYSDEADVVAEHAQPPVTGEVLPLDALVALVQAEAGAGRRVSVTLPDREASLVRIGVDHGNGAQRDRIDYFDVSRDGRTILPVDSSAGRSPALEARVYLRFLHTGEIYGLTGQTIAGLASLFAMLLVYTGFCLGLARLWRMLRARRPGTSTG